MMIRCGIYPTQARIAKWRPSQTFDASCRLCSAAKDTTGHRLGSCLNRSIKNQICAGPGHGHAVHALAMEIRSGTLGDWSSWVLNEYNYEGYVYIYVGMQMLIRFAVYT